LLDDDEDAAVAAATSRLQAFPERFQRHWASGMRAKLGLADAAADETTDALSGDLLDLMREHGADHASTFRALAASLRGEPAAMRALFEESPAFGAWERRWREQIRLAQTPLGEIADAMDRVNAVYIPRNHQVEAALTAATAGDLEPFERLVDVLARPFEARRGFEAYAEPAPAGCGPYRTFCGT
jgi:protein adenylyltransferase